MATALHPVTLLGLALCLGQPVRMQHELLPKPSIAAEPGPVVPQGRPVTIVCQSPGGADTFRLEWEVITQYRDEQACGSQRTEARFPISAVNERTAGSYFCRYQNGSSWSAKSESLELVMTDEDISTLPSGTTRVISSKPLTLTESHSSAGLSPEYVYIFIGVSVALLLCLLLLVLLLVHRQHQKKHGPSSSKSEEQWPQERLSPAVDIIEKTPDVATVDKIPEKYRKMQSPSPDAGDSQEVTYAQLDHRARTLRATQAMSPQSMEPMTDASTYAALARH